MSLALQSDPHLSQRFPLLSWRTFFRATVAATLLTLIPGYFWAQHREQVRRYQGWKRDQKLLLALQTEVSIGQPMPRDSTLEVELAAFARQTGVPYYLDESCRKGGIRANLQVVMYEEILGDHLEPLEDAQNRVLHSVLADNPYGLNVKMSGGKLVLHYDINRNTSGPILYQRAYATPPCQPEGAIQDEATLVELVKRAIDPYSWDDVGGPAGIREVPGGILIRQTAEVHTQVERFLSRLTALENPPQDTVPIPLTIYGSTSSEQRIIATLDRVSDFDYPETPLKEVMADVSRRFEIPVYLATKQLEEAAINLETPVTVYLPHVSVKTFLRTCCHDLGLQYSIRRGCVRIAPAVDCCGHQLALYPVGDLLGPDQQHDMQTLREAILLTVYPDSWSLMDGDAEILPVATGWFLVRHSGEVHEELLGFLARLRASIKGPQFMQSRQKTRDDVARENILQVLEENFSPDDQVQTLKEFVDHLQTVLDFPVRFDCNRLELEAVNIETPIVTHPEIQPLGRQLDATLASAGVVFTVWNESLLITSRSFREFRPEVFDVRDLTTFGSGLMSELELQSLVFSAALPNDWENGNGPWTACWYRGRLIVGNHEQALASVRSLLDFLHDHRESLPRLEEVQRKKAFVPRKATENPWERAYLQFVAAPVIVNSQILPESVPRRMRTKGSGRWGPPF